MNGIGKFREFLSDVSSVASVLTKLAVVFPLADLAIKIGPPEPRGLPFLTSAIMLLTLILVFQYWSRLDHLLLNNRLIQAAVAFILSVIFYVFFSSGYTKLETLPTGKTERFVVGYEVSEPSKSDILSVVAAERDRFRTEVGEERQQILNNAIGVGCHYGTDDSVTIYRFCDPVEIPRPEESLSRIQAEVYQKYLESGHDPLLFYTRLSRSIIIVTLVALWFGMFSALVSCLGAFVLLRGGPRFPLGLTP